MLSVTNHSRSHAAGNWEAPSVFLESMDKLKTVSQAEVGLQAAFLEFENSLLPTIKAYLNLKPLLPAADPSSGTYQQKPAPEAKPVLIIPGLLLVQQTCAFRAEPPTGPFPFPTPMCLSLHRSLTSFQMQLLVEKRQQSGAL